MKKFLSLMLALVMLMSLSSVSSYASDDDSDTRSSSISSSDDDSDDDNDSGADSDNENESDDSGMDSDDDAEEKGTTSGSGTGMGAGKATFKEFTITKKTEAAEVLRVKREEMKDAIEANKEEAQENRENFRIVNGTHIKEAKLNLTEAQKVSLSDLHFSHKKEMETLRQEIKNSTTLEEREVIYDEMKALAETHYDEVKAIVGDGAASELIEKRKAVWEENEMLRDDNRAMRNEYKEVKRTIVEKYRKAFVSKLGNSLDKIPAEKLPQIVERINAMMEKEGTSETMMAALLAILELVEEKMEGDDVESDILDVVESLLQ